MASGEFNIRYFFTLVDHFSAAANAIIKKNGQLRSELERTNDALKPFVKTMGELNKSIRDYKTNIQGIKSPTINYRNQIRHAKTETISFTSQLNKASQALFRVGAALSVFNTLPVGMAMRKGAEEYRKVERQISDIQKKTGVNRATAMRFAGDLSKNSQVSGSDGRKYSGFFSREDILKVVSEFGGTGVGSHLSGRERLDYLNTYSDTVLKAKDAFQMKNLDELTAFTKKIVAAGNMTQKQLNSFMDYTNVLGNTGPATESELVKFMAGKGMAMAIASYQDKTKGAMSAMALGEAAISLGVSPRRSSSFINAVTTYLADAERTGDTRFSKEMYNDPAKAMLAMLKAAQKNPDQYSFFRKMVEVTGVDYGKLTKALSDTTIVELLQQRLDIRDDYTKSGFVKIAEDLGMTLDESFKIVVESFDGQLNAAKTNLANIGAKLFETVMPVFIDFLKNFNENAPKFIAFIEKHPTLTKWALGLTAVAAAAGPLLIILSTLAQGFIGVSIVAGLLGNALSAPIIAGLGTSLGVMGASASAPALAGTTTAIAGATAASGGMGIFGSLMAGLAGLGAVIGGVLLNPVTWVVAALAALSAGLVVVYTKSETFRRIINTTFELTWVILCKVFDGLKTIATQLYVAISSILESTFNILKSIWNNPLMAPIRNHIMTNVENAEKYIQEQKRKSGSLSETYTGITPSGGKQSDTIINIDPQKNTISRGSKTIGDSRRNSYSVQNMQTGMGH